MLLALRKNGIRSLMVEGGARIIDSFLATPALVDNVIVTVAPTFVGKQGVGYSGADYVGLTPYLAVQQLPDCRTRFRLCSTSQHKCLA
jgi:riboflavin biosynthesis pyrimidine reductase